mgnify:FL=1
MIFEKYENTTQHDMLKVFKHLKTRFKNLTYTCFSGSYAHMSNNKIELSIQYLSHNKKILVYGQKKFILGTNMKYERFFTNYDSSIMSLKLAINK